MGVLSKPVEPLIYGIDSINGSAFDIMPTFLVASSKIIEEESCISTIGPLEREKTDAEARREF